MVAWSVISTGVLVITTEAERSPTAIAHDSHFLAISDLIPHKTPEDYLLTRV
jgi:hypothetical protein